MNSRTTRNTTKQAALNTLCPVCGYNMDYPPEDYNICPSCGTEFGVNDANSTVSELREVWLQSGPRWWSSTDQSPTGWNPEKQLSELRLLENLANASGPFEDSERHLKTGNRTR